jgi:regulatory protein
MKKLDKDLLSYLEWCAEKYLSIRPRSEFELIRYLRQKVRKRYPAFIEEQDAYIDTILNRYKQSGGINDTEFIGWWIRERTDFKPRGARMLRQELQQKGVTSETIDNYLSEHPLDEDALLEALFLKRARLVDFTSQKEVQKLIQFFLRKGFSYTQIKKAIEDYTTAE